MEHGIVYEGDAKSEGARQENSPERLLTRPAENEAVLIGICNLLRAAVKVHYRYRETVYHIEVLQTHEDKGEASVIVDGVERPDKAIPLLEDRLEDWVEV
jgi:hypothetical protein